MNVYKVQATIRHGGEYIPEDEHYAHKHIDQIITCPTAADAKLIMQTAYPQAKVDRPVLLLKLN